MIDQICSSPVAGTCSTHEGFTSRPLGYRSLAVPSWPQRVEAMSSVSSSAQATASTPTPPGPSWSSSGHSWADSWNLAGSAIAEVLESGDMMAIRARVLLAQQRSQALGPPLPIRGFPLPPEGAGCKLCQRVYRDTRNPVPSRNSSPFLTPSRVGALECVSCRNVKRWAFKTWDTRELLQKTHMARASTSSMSSSSSSTKTNAPRRRMQC